MTGRRPGTIAFLVSLAVGLPLAAALPQPSQRADLGLRTARWLDPEAGRYHGPSIILVTAGRISGIVGAEAFDPKGAGQVIDLGEATALPGLIDAHVHLAIGGEPRANAAATLRAGFTTVVDLGAISDAVLRLRDAIAAGTAEGPHVLAAGLWVGTTGGVCDFKGIGLRGPDGFRRRVGENVSAGADLIKVCVSGWAADGLERPDAYEIADDALAAVVDDSHRNGRLVIAHAISPGAVRAVLRSGVDGLAHTAYLDAATADQLQARGVFLIPTLASLLPGKPSPVSVALRDSIGLAHRRGVRLVFGTDGGVLPHGQNAREFAALVDAGIPAIDAIRAATVNAARALRTEDSIGSLAVGRRADIIAVSGDPLRDIAALSRVTFVMHGGRIVIAPTPRGD